MTLESTIDVVWRERRNCWTVEGGNGWTAALGIIATHERKEDAVRDARRTAREYGVSVRVLDEPVDPNTNR